MDQKKPEPPKPVISRTWMCKCGAVFGDYEVYRKHKDAHRAGEKIIERDPVTNEPVGQEPIVEPVPIKEPELPKPTVLDTNTVVKSKIKLNYKYEGNCPTCGKEVETIELEDINNDNKHVFAVAWCSNCKKKLQQNYVNKL